MVVTRTVNLFKFAMGLDELMLTECPALWLTGEQVGSHGRKLAIHLAQSIVAGTDAIRMKMGADPGSRDRHPRCWILVTPGSRCHRLDTPRKVITKNIPKTTGRLPAHIAALARSALHYRHISLIEKILDLTEIQAGRPRLEVRSRGFLDIRDREHHPRFYGVIGLPRLRLQRSAYAMVNRMSVKARHRKLRLYESAEPGLSDSWVSTAGNTNDHVYRRSEEDSFQSKYLY